MKLWLTLIILLLSALPAGAARDTEAANRDLAKVREQIATLERQVKARNAKRSEEEKALRAAEVAESEARGRLSRLRQQIDAARSRLADLEKQAGKLQADLTSELDLLSRQLRAAYMTGQTESLRLLLSQQDPVATARMMVYHGYVSRARSEVISQVRERLGALQAARAAVNEESQALAALQSSQEEQLKELGRQRESRAQALARVDRDVAGDQEKLKRLQAQAGELQKLITELGRVVARLPADNATAFGRQKGKMPWPAAGQPVRRFGQPRADGRLRWDGVLLAAPAGSPVQAIHDGRVVFADWLPGLGLLLVVDHGDGYLSLYGQNQELLRRPGDPVRTGDVVSRVGDSGGQADSGLYFEIRKNGKPVNPADWVR